MHLALTLAALMMTGTAMAGTARDTFNNIDGGQIDLSDWAGRPILVVNTASLCGYTPQFEGLQALYDLYRERGLVVLAVPSNDFAQELATGAEVKDYCETTFGLDLPMTDITHVKGPEAHPFFQWLLKDAGFEPQWNFNKVLLDGSGTVVATYGSGVNPLSPKITDAVDGLLN